MILCHIFYFYFFFFQAEDGIRDKGMWLEFSRVLFRSRPDLKVIITSATIDTERFSRHFDHAPVIEVSGRTYPVEVRYRSLLDDNKASEAKSDDEQEDRKSVV